MLQVTAEVSARQIKLPKQLDEEIEAYTNGTGATWEVTRFSRFNEHRHAFTVTGDLPSIVRFVERFADDSPDAEVRTVQVMRTMRTAVHLVS